MSRFRVVIGFLLFVTLLVVSVAQAEEAITIEQPVAVPVNDIQKEVDSQRSGIASVETEGQKRSAILGGEKEQYGVATGSLVNTAIGLVVVLAMIIGMAWLLRRFGGLPTVGKGAVSIVGGVSLGARERAVLLQVGEEQVLVGVAPGQVRALHVLGQKLVSPEAKGAQEFSSQLDVAMKGDRT